MRCANLLPVRQLLRVIRYSEPEASSFALAMLLRLLVVLRVRGALQSDQYTRLVALAGNACRFAFQANMHRSAGALQRCVAEHRT